MIRRLLARGADTSTTDDLVFREVQRFKDTLLWPVVLVPIVAVCVWVLIVAVRTLFFHGGEGVGFAAGAAVVGVAFYLIKGFTWLAILCYIMRLEVEVRRGGVYLRLLPFQLKARHIAWSEIRSAVVTRYHVFGAPGGRGYLRGRGWRAYTVKGNQGVQLETTDGHRLLIGSQIPHDLAAAITSSVPA